MKIPGYRFLIVALSAALLVLTIGGAPAYAADDYPAQQISAQQRCPVCGMYPARYPAWAAQVVFKDHSMIAVESPAELFRFLRDVKKYDARHDISDIARMYATDYAKRVWIDAKQALYVQGSKVKGPMGMSDDLPAFASKSDAEAFAKESGGNVVTFDALSSAKMDSHMHMDHGEHAQGR